MKCPFEELEFDGCYIAEKRTGEEVFRCRTPREAAFLVQCINNWDKMMDIIEEAITGYNNLPNSSFILAESIKSAQQFLAESGTGIKRKMVKNAKHKSASRIAQ